MVSLKIHQGGHNKGSTILYIGNGKGMSDNERDK